MYSPSENFMKDNDEKEYQPTTAQKVKQMKGWENMDDKLAQRIAETVVKFSELFYITIAREMNLNPVQETDVEVRDEKPKRRKKKSKSGD